MMLINIAPTIFIESLLINMDILLTGASGFVGGHLVTQLSQKHRLFALTRQPPMLEQKGLSWISGDLSRPDLPASLPEKIDAVVCLAQSRAYRQFPEKASDIFNVNVLGTLALLDYARHAGAHTFIFTSTANVYRQSSSHINEEFDLEPRSFYASTKRMAEMLIESYAEFFACSVLRLFTVYGPGQKEMLIPNLVERIRNGQPLRVQGKHGFKTSPVYVDDLKRIIDKLLERENPNPDFQVFNVGGDEILGIYELGIAIGAALKLTPRFEYIKGHEALGWIADNSKLKAALDLNSFTPFTDGIKKITERE